MKSPGGKNGNLFEMARMRIQRTPARGLTCQRLQNSRVGERADSDSIHAAQASTNGKAPTRGRLRYSWESSQSRYSTIALSSPSL